MKKIKIIVRSYPAVGTELLTGDTLNTNVMFLSKELSINGFSVLYHTTVGDNPGRLKSVIMRALTRSDLIITTGGLGPTQDDLTKETIAEIFGMEMEQRPEIVEKLKAFFDRRGVEMTENNLRQSYVPKGGVMLPNPRGTAPGIMIEKDGKTVIMLPGPPHEMMGMYEDCVEPILHQLKFHAITIFRILVNPLLRTPSWISLTGRIIQRLPPMPSWAR